MIFDSVSQNPTTFLYLSIGRCNQIVILRYLTSSWKIKKGYRTIEYSDITFSWREAFEYTIIHLFSWAWSQTQHRAHHWSIEGQWNASFLDKFRGTRDTALSSCFVTMGLHSDGNCLWENGHWLPTVIEKMTADCRLSRWLNDSGTTVINYHSFVTYCTCKIDIIG